AVASFAAIENALFQPLIEDAGPLGGSRAFDACIAKFRVELREQYETALLRAWSIKDEIRNRSRSAPHVGAAVLPRNVCGIAGKARCLQGLYDLCVMDAFDTDQATQLGGDRCADSLRAARSAKRKRGAAMPPPRPYSFISTDLVSRYASSPSRPCSWP